VDGCDVLVEGGASRDFRRVKAWAYRDPEGFGALIELIIDATIDYLAGRSTQARRPYSSSTAGRGFVRAGFERWVIEPTKRITARLKERFPTIPVIGFPRGAALLYQRYVAESAWPR